MRKPIICETCGTELQIADWPFCPHPSTRWPDPMLETLSPITIREVGSFKVHTHVRILDPGDTEPC